MRTYQTIVDEISALLAEQGDSPRFASFNGETLNFGFETKLSSKSSMQIGGVSTSLKPEIVESKSNNLVTNSDYSDFFKQPDIQKETLTVPPKLDRSFTTTGAQQDISPGDQKYIGTNAQLQLPNSSNIQSAAYWPKQQLLLVAFKSGSTYSYSNVPLNTVLLWEKAPSAGKFHYHNIRMNYPYQRR